MNKKGFILIDGLLAIYLVIVVVMIVFNLYRSELNIYQYEYHDDLVKYYFKNIEECLCTKKD